MKYLLVTLLVLSIHTFAQESEQENGDVTFTTKQPPLTPEQIRFQQEIRWQKMKKESLEDGKRGTFDASKKKDRSIENRKIHKQAAFFNLSVIDTWIPMKWGLTYSYAHNQMDTYEVEYLRGRLASPLLIDDLGSITDQRLGVRYRSFKKRNNLNVIYGVNYSSFRVKLGPDYLDTISGNSSNYDMLNIKTLGVSYGLGSRWQHSNQLTYGVDWFVINLPILTLQSKNPFSDKSSSSSKKEDVRDAINFFKKLPTITLLKLQVGMSF